MRVLIWIAEGTWERLLEQAVPLLTAEAELTLVHVAPKDVEDVARGSHLGLLGRHPPPPPPLDAITQEQAEGLLQAARQQLGRPARLLARRGRAEREVVSASAEADLLIIARDGEPRPGPRSFGPHSRFIVDHATCPVLVLPRQPADPPGDTTPSRRA